MFIRTDTNTSHYIPRDVAESWGLFADGIEYKDGESLDLCIDEECLLLILEYYTKIKMHDSVLIPKPLPLEAAYVMSFEDALGHELRKESAWINEVAQRSRNRILLWKLFEACNFLHAQRLLDLCSARIAFQYKNLTVEEMRESLRMF